MSRILSGKGLHAWGDWGHAMVTSYSMNSIMKASAQANFHLSMLTPRMKSILINQYKRGYTTAYSNGMQSNVTKILKNTFGGEVLPAITKYGGTIVDGPKVFTEWVETAGGLCGAKSQNNGEGYFRWHFGGSPWGRTVRDTEPMIQAGKEFQKSAIKKLKESGYLDQDVMYRNRAIQAIEDGETITINIK